MGVWASQIGDDGPLSRGLRAKSSPASCLPQGDKMLGVGVGVGRRQLQDNHLWAFRILEEWAMEWESKGGLQPGSR